MVDLRPQFPQLPIASVVRRWLYGCCRATLYWDVNKSRLSVVYEETTDTPSDYRIEIIPDWCVKNWLDRFVRDESNLNHQSYFRIFPPTPAWAAIIRQIMYFHPRESAYT